MELNPIYTAAGSIFKNNPMFFVPTYQRAYAWDTEAILDFIKDLKNCFINRKNNSPNSHFFGGILSVSCQVPGVVDQNEYEIIDGQQRIATFTLLMSALVRLYKELEIEATDLNDCSNKDILEDRIKTINSRFIEFRQEVQRKFRTVEVLKLSKADNEFYKCLIRDMNPSEERDSHKKINNAFKKIYEEVKEIIQASSLDEKMDNLEIIQNVVDSDFTILHMITQTRDDAFRLFQVINDRGQGLTEGDLLRAKTLEMLESYDSYQNSAEDLWINILKDSQSDTKKYLNWIYESVVGRRATQKELFDEFLSQFFPQHKLQTITQEDAKKILSTINEIDQNTLICRKLVEGQWLYPEHQPITGWDRNCLVVLMRDLSHDLAIPLLLCASKLDHRKFSEIVQIIDKAYFRYKIICEQRPEGLKKIYLDEAQKIRANPDVYTLNNLRQDLKSLVDSKASKDFFKEKLKSYKYKVSGEGSNKPLKYLLIMTEYYYQWFITGATGSPSCLDKSRIYDFAGTSIEHIYSKNAKPMQNNYDEMLEPLKNSLGNLTILDPTQNNTADDVIFLDKKQIYTASSIALTRDGVGTKPLWGTQQIEDHQNLIVDIAMKVFCP
jgi:Protein of unknown function DUF262/Protein of unknown function (DUF1524)